MHPGNENDVLDAIAQLVHPTMKGTEHNDT